MAQRRRCSFTIFIPTSILSDVPSLIEKTFKAGQIARSASIFRVNRIVLYKDSSGASREDAFILRDLLSYAETPQYLRRRIFPILDSLKYAGLLPPLRTPHHPLESTDTPFREGFVLSSSPRGSRVVVGLGGSVETPTPLTVNSRVTLRLEGDRWLPCSREEVPLYWGYELALEFKSLTRLLADSSYDAVIATSRIGMPLASVATKVGKILSGSRKIALLFGSPSEGLHEIVRREGGQLDNLVDLVINTAPDQGTATIRTEEALTISLAAISIIDALQSR